MFLSIFLSIKIQDLQLLRDLRYYVNCCFMAMKPYKPGFNTIAIKTVNSFQTIKTFCFGKSLENNLVRIIEHFKYLNGFKRV